MLQYAQDYDERYPKYWRNQTQTDTSMPGAVFITSDGSTAGNLTSWMDFISPYIKNTQIFVCPSAVLRETSAPSYGYNRLIHNSGGTPRSLGEILRPAETLLNLDYASRYGTYANCIEYTSFKNAGNYVCPHNDGTNVTYCDGHAKWLSKSDVAFADTSEATNRYWNPTLP